MRAERSPEDHRSVESLGLFVGTKAGPCGRDHYQTALEHELHLLYQVYFNSQMVWGDKLNDQAMAAARRCS